VKLSLHAGLIKKRTALCAIPGVKRASMASVQCAGSIAPITSETMAASAESQMLMVVELVILFGMSRSASGITQNLAVRSGEPYGILNAEPASTMLGAAFAHLTARMAKPTSAFHAPKSHTAALLASPLSALLGLRCLAFSVIHLVRQDIRATVLFAGNNAPQASKTAEALSALTLPTSAQTL